MSYGQPCNRMTGGPSAGPSSAYPTLSRPASTCLRAGNEVRPALVGGAAGGVEEHAAAEVAATAATPIASENSRLVIMCGPLLMGDMPPAEKTWTCLQIHCGEWQPVSHILRKTDDIGRPPTPPASLADDDFVDVDAHRDGHGNGMPTLVATVHDPFHRDDDPSEFSVIVHVVRCRRSRGDVDLIVPAPQKSVGVDVQHLVGAVGTDALGVVHPEPTPCLTVLVPGTEFLGLHAGKGQGIGFGEVGPHRVAGEVGQLQHRPGRLQGVLAERLARC